MNTYKRHRFPPDIISYAVWLYHRFNLSHRDIEDLLAERGITVSREAIRLFSKMIAKLEKRVAELSVSQESLNQTAIRRRQRFEDRKGVLISKRHLLDAQWIELVREKPVGIVSRAFFGGRAAAAAEIKRCMRIVESRRDDIDRELVAISAELNKPREKPKMSSADRQKMLRDQERTLADYRFLLRHINQLF